MKAKTRKFVFFFFSTEIADEKQVVVKKVYPCKVNAAVPFSHRMLR